jgi:hypothetical protein
MRRAIMVACLILIGLAGVAEADQPSVNDYIAWNDVSRIAYIRGCVDGFQAAITAETYVTKQPVSTVPLAPFWDRCFAGKTYLQMQAIMEKAIAKQPEHWQEGLGDALVDSILDACPARASTIK